MNTPEELRYSPDHEWVKAEQDGRVRVGITDYAQDALGDVVYVELPEVGASVTPGGPMSEVESTKSVSDVYAPVDGIVVEINGELIDTPERINEDPYGDGWLCVIQLSDGATTDHLLTAGGYRELTEG
jgi:glycine cleavage system H protein